MDSVDICILRDLSQNCRASYQDMGRELGMTANAIKKRINRLIESGTIHSFVVYLTPAMADVEEYLAIVTIDEMKNEERILNTIVEDPHVFSTGSLSDGTCIVYAEYEGSENERELENFLKTIRGITEVEIHRLISNPGSKVDFKPLEFRVLNKLFQNPRMPATEVAAMTGLTPRRVRRIITRLVESGGLQFGARLNLNTGPGVTYYVQIIWDESQATHTEMEYWLDKKFPGKYFDSVISVSSPMMLSLFVIDHLREAELLSREISLKSMIKSVRSIFPYPTKKNVRLKRIKLEELLKKSQQ